MSQSESTMPVLSLSEYGVRFGDKVVLASVDLEVPAQGPFVLLGPAGTGKSTLLRSLAGFNDCNPRFVSWGHATYAGRPLDDDHRPLLMNQSARLAMATIGENLVHNHPQRRHLSPIDKRELAASLCVAHGIPEFRDRLDETVIDLGIAEQRTIALVRLAAAEPTLLFLDEPTTDIDDDAAASLLERIAAEAAARAVFVVLHNQAHARRLEGQGALLAGGYVVESGSTQTLLARPATRLGQQYVRTGSCTLPSPDADPAELDPGAEAPGELPESAAPPVPSQSRGPSGFMWVHPGRLAGTPLPGVFHGLEYDLEALQRMGVTFLVSLTQVSLPEEVLHGYGMQVTRSPIPDMGAPGLTQAWELCRRIEEALEAGEVVAVHCRAGLGRTGTVLACYRVWEGADAIDALDEVRGIDARWVQSEEQVRFIEQFGKTLERHGRRGRARGAE